jgi:hypothetical protein
MSSVINDGNLKFGKNAPYFDPTPETRKSEIRKSKPETNSNEQNTKYQNGKTTVPLQLCFEFLTLPFIPGYDLK